jgi:hypothetical protein
MTFHFYFQFICFVSSCFLLQLYLFSISLPPHDPCHVELPRPRTPTLAIPWNRVDLDFYPTRSQAALPMFSSATSDEVR